MSRESTFEEVRSWPIADQLDLVFYLWDEIIDGGWTPQPSEQLRAEPRRRLAAHEAAPTEVLTWERVVADIRRSR